MTDTPKKDTRPQFDADVSPNHVNNREAAKAHGLVYKNGYYRDADGSLRRDRFGQPL